MFSVTDFANKCLNVFKSSGDSIFSINGFRPPCCIAGDLAMQLLNENTLSNRQFIYMYWKRNTYGVKEVFNRLISGQEIEIVVDGILNQSENEIISTLTESIPRHDDTVDAKAINCGLHQHLDTVVLDNL